jgi:hypothetical protein
VRTYIELDGKAASWGATRILITTPRNAGYIVGGRMYGSRCEELTLQGSDRQFVPASWPGNAQTGNDHPAPLWTTGEVLANRDLPVDSCKRFDS